MKKLVSVLRRLDFAVMTNQSQGIQQLLAAEKIAADKVGEARKRKTRRLKQAKDEATEEIEKYRLEREKQFKDFEVQHMGTREGVASRIDKDAKQKLEEMTRALAANKEAVINDVLRLVYDIEPKLHKNYRL